jgi:pimeloyl-ACP methyl ester carboxylesterase
MNDTRRTTAAYEAENALFKEYGIAHRDHFIALAKYGITLRVTEVGAGLPVIVIPGNVGDAYPFIPLLPELPGRTIYLVNRPGGGMSGAVDYGCVDFRQCALDTIHEVMSAFNITDTDLIGHSLGGHWTLWFAQAEPKKVKSLTLLGVPGGLPRTSPPLAMRLMQLSIITAIIRRVMQSHTEKSIIKMPQAISGPYTSQAMFECRKAFMALPDYSRTFFSILQAEPAYKKQLLHDAELAAIHTPSLLIWGMKDPFGKPAAGRAITGIMPDGSFHEIPGGSHLPWLDQPAQCGELIREFWGQR